MHGQRNEKDITEKLRLLKACQHKYLDSEDIKN